MCVRIDNIFFLPWAQFFFFKGSGYDIAINIGSYANLAWLIPGFSLLTIILGTMGKNQKVAALITGSLPIIGLIYSVIKVGSDIFHVLAIGAYLTIISAILMILSALEVINMPKTINKGGYN